MPEECASIRSMARCVLPVLVGPRTAVTPAPRARVPRGGCGEKLRVITGPDWQPGLAVEARPRCSCITMRRRARPRLRFGTGAERTAPESLETAQSDFVHYDM